MKAIRDESYRPAVTWSGRIAVDVTVRASSPRATILNGKEQPFSMWTNVTDEQAMNSQPSKCSILLSDPLPIGLILFSSRKL
jgi:hypothetical protein